MNELPCLPPRSVIQAARKGLYKLNRYSTQADYEHLKRLLARYTGVNEECIVLGPGSDFLLREIMILFSTGKKMIIINPSFLPTVENAKKFATRLVRLRLHHPDFGLDPRNLLDELREPTLVVIDNPNNPTGRILVDHRIAEEILARKDTFLIIDEAYYEFSGVTLADLVRDHPNLVISRTLDKAFGLAGARIGYLIAGQSFINAFSSFTAILPQSSLCAAIEALSSIGYMKKNVRRIVRERERVQKELADMGIRAYSSHTNFLLIDMKIREAAFKLEKRGILVSDTSNQLPQGFIRVSIGTPSENNAFLRGCAGLLDTREQNEPVP
jgi:histidinol-phosphate aminotransferase